MTISCWNIMNSSGSTEMLDRIYGSPHLELVPVLLSLVLLSSAVVGMTAVPTHGANLLILPVQCLDRHCGCKLQLFLLLLSRRPKCLRLTAPRHCGCKLRLFLLLLPRRPMCLRLSAPRHHRSHNLLQMFLNLPIHTKLCRQLAL